MLNLVQLHRKELFPEVITQLAYVKPNLITRVRCLLNTWSIMATSSDANGPDKINGLGLFKFGFSSNKIVNEKAETSTLKRKESKLKYEQEKRVKRKFRPEWCNLYEGLLYDDQTVHEVQILHCPW